MQFRTSHLENLYEISHETVRAWTIEFSKYLSPTANPGGGKKRLYQKDDLAVFSLVVELRKQGMDFSDIHAALENGQRGEVPDLDAEEIQAIVSSDAETRLSLENERLRQALVVAQDELKKAQKDLEQMQGIKEENIRLQTQLDNYQEVQPRLEKRIEELTQEVKELSLQIGREYAKGYVEGFDRREQTQDK